MANSSGTHCVCVCTIHQNIKLMIVGSKLDKITKDTDYELNTYSDCLAAVLCSSPEPDCHLGVCNKCQSLDRFKEKMLEILAEVAEIEYKQWTSTDRASLLAVTESTEEFVDKFCENLKQLKRHDFVAKQQAKFCSEKKERLADGEVLVVCDFAENYSFVLQDAAQAFHWNNSQATLHPFVAYYKTEGELKHTSLVVVSDCLTHDTIAVHVFQRSLISHLCQHLGRTPSKVIYFSDGAASQYKNFKNLINLCHHQEDFGCAAEWHFFATSHGKGPCDGIGGTVKRLAAKASLQRPYNDQIMTARDLFHFALENIPSVAVQFSSESDYEKEAGVLEQRFSIGRTVKGTQRLHAFFPVSATRLDCKDYSNSVICRRVDVTCDMSQEVDLSEIRGFVTAVWNGQWYLASVMEVDSLLGDVKLSFLQPPGPASSFSFPSCSDIGLVPSTAIMLSVDPLMTGRSGRAYKLSRKEIEDTRKRLDWVAKLKQSKH